MKDEELDSLLNNAARTPLSPDPERLQRISAFIQSSLRPVRPLPPAWAIAAGLTLICAAVSFAGAARVGFAGFDKMYPAERFVIFFTLIALAWTLAGRFVREMIPASRRRVSSGALLALTCVALLAVFAALFHDYHTDQFVAIGIACLRTGFLHAIPAGLLGWLLLRRGFAVNAVSAGLIAGALAGLAGLGVLELQCPNFQAAHILVWHTGVVPLSSAAGACVGWLVRRLTRSTRARF